MKKLVIIVLFCISNIAFSQNSQPDITETEFLNLKSEIKSLKISVDSLNQVTQNLTIENNKLQLTREFYKDILSTTIGFFGAFLTVISIIGAYISWLRNSNILRGAENIRNQMLEDFKKEIKPVQSLYQSIKIMEEKLNETERKSQELNIEIEKTSTEAAGHSFCIQERFIEAFHSILHFLLLELKNPSPNPNIKPILTNMIDTISNIDVKHDFDNDILKEIEKEEANIKELSAYKSIFREYEQIMKAFYQRIDNLKNNKLYTKEEREQIQSLIKMIDKKYN